MAKTNKLYIVVHGKNILSDWIAYPAWTRNISLAHTMTEDEAMRKQDDLVVYNYYVGVKVVKLSEFKMGKAIDKFISDL